MSGRFGKYGDIKRKSRLRKGMIEDVGRRGYSKGKPSKGVGGRKKERARNKREAY